MDGQRFDALARAVAARPSRRQLLRGLAGSAIAGMLTLRDAKRLRAQEDGASRVRVCFDGQTVEVPLPLVDARLFPGLTVGPCPPDGGCTADADCGGLDPDSCIGNACVDGECVPFSVDCIVGAVCCGNGECCEACGPTVCAPGDVCCNPSCGICTPPGEACIQVACEPCGDVTCPVGQVCCNPSCGICTEPGGGCIEIYCE